MKKHIIYLTTNCLTGKIYIGYHFMKNENDSYLGSGKILKKAIEKYSRDNFKRTILYRFSSKKDALSKELELVDERFIERNDTYNIKLGGEGGWDHIHKRIKNDSLFRENFSKTMKKAVSKAVKEGKIPNWKDNKKNKSAWNKGKKLSASHKNKISKNNGNLLEDETIKQRYLDYLKEPKNRGYISRLSKKWNISHTSVRRMIEKF